MICILRLALTDDGGKWLPGTVLSVHEIEERNSMIGVGEMVTFLPILAASSKYSFFEIKREWRLKKMVLLNTILSPESLLIRRDVKANSRLVMHKKGLPTLEVNGDIVQPRWDKIVGLDTPGRLMDTPKSQWPAIPTLGEGI